MVTRPSVSLYATPFNYSDVLHKINQIAQHPPPGKCGLKWGQATRHSPRMSTGCFKERLIEVCTKARSCSSRLTRALD